MQPNHVSMPLGIVIRKSPGVNRWAGWNWNAVAVLPGAAPADWQEIRREGEAIEYHACTVDLEFWRSDTEAYLTCLSSKTPSIYVVLRREGTQGVEVLLATASPYDAQDYEESGDEIVSRVPMPDGLIAFVRDFIADHHEEEVFVKRKRKKHFDDLVEDGIGDARISQLTDVYRAPKREVAR